MRKTLIDWLQNRGVKWSYFGKNRLDITQTFVVTTPFSKPPFFLFVTDND